MIARTAEQQPKRNISEHMPKGKPAVRAAGLWSQ